ncbi:M16 family metallopeptidase [Phreatobacter stygius]|uniref:Insulinase family protein n=1 Tax=Phreatobacter stygius TaxID=1940610 RepID=A0A4D7BH48_9HYPH|nr:insulinase family protein [Phreatobacter stygius]QCI67127.1 insulinase family protein [Phreatobacter stygius]
MPGLRALLVVLAVTGLAAAQPVAAAERQVADRVFLVSDAKARFVQFQMIVLAGCADEAGNDCRGIAHYLEHLVLVGRNAEHRDTALRFFSDGSSNGWTTSRITGYVHRYPADAPDAADRLDRLFAFYAARLGGFEITPQDALRERNVVLQEYNWRVGANPFSPVWQEVDRFLYPDHPLGQWTIGTPATISALTSDDGRGFLAAWYRRSNVYFIVTGPVEEDLLRRTAAKYLAPLDPALPPARPWLGRRPNLAPARMVFLREDQRIAAVTVTVSRAIAFADQDPVKTLAARALIAQFLSSKLSGSPHSRLVEQDAVAATIRNVTFERVMDGVLQVGLTAVPEPDVARERLAEALRTYLRELAVQGIDEAMLDRLKRRYAMRHKTELDDPQTAPARLISWLGHPLPYERLAELAPAVASIRPEEVNALLRATTAEGREATVIFAPTGTQ